MRRIRHPRSDPGGQAAGRRFPLDLLYLIIAFAVAAPTGLTVLFYGLGLAH